MEPESPDRAGHRRGLRGLPDPGRCRTGRAQIPFDDAVIDSTNSGDCKGLGDIDGDGLPDAVLGGTGGLWWYRYPNWTRYRIATPNQEFTTGHAAGGRGRRRRSRHRGPRTAPPAGSAGSRIPRPSGNPATSTWTFHLIGVAGNWVHDVQVTDLNGDGRIDVVTGDHVGYQAWIQNSPTNWTRVDISGRAGTGLSLGDIDGDGRPDVVLGPVWLKTPTDPIGGTWTERTIAGGWPSETASVVVDINGDGRRDVVIVPSESTGRLSWYQAPANPLTGAWTEHIVTSSIGYVHAFSVVDMDKDGALDVVFAEQGAVEREAGSDTFWAARGHAVDAAGDRHDRLAQHPRRRYRGRRRPGHPRGQLAGPPLEAWINRTDPAPCASDWNHNGAIEPSDVAAFVNDWFISLTAATLVADFNSDHAITPADVAMFINTWYDELLHGCG